MIKNTAGDKVTAKKFVQEMYAASVNASVDSVGDDSFFDSDFTERERTLVRDQVKRLSKRLLKVCGVKATNGVVEPDEVDEDTADVE